MPADLGPQGVPGVGATAPTPAPDDLGAQLAAAVIRHGMTTVAGMAVANGAISTDQQTQFVSIATGIALWLAGVAWSFISKWLRAHGYR